MEKVIHVSYTIWALGITAAELLDEGDLGFETRVAVQKVVYFLQRLGLVKGYVFGPYLHGPYSRELADDYMWLARKGDKFIEELAAQCRCQELEKWVNYLGEVDIRTLATASTLDWLLQFKKDLEAARRHLKLIKPWITDEDVSAAETVLRDLGLLTDANSQKAYIALT
ncbi:hypothetical protein [Pyrobaculum ferrireducens]|uniref:Uncharacterized protein n=1 Tax=Pyrobaculum ferrireducens TaxID=1104324 RepID=G7VF35_9CREN|nr:hypothetical protein [Pyrobaculum ferrireducens]AET34200.1 hypothetical protein P186_2824 [Pyrobaculum ferrireducens]